MALRYNAKDGETVDLICWTYYGRTDQGVVETVLTHNPGLADIGPVLPAGTAIVFPVIAVPERVEGVKLWD